MNALETKVTKLLSKPYYHEKKDVWVVEYEWECYGQTSTSKNWFKTKEDAEQFKVGHVYMG